ncbi:hypothetical protein K227x_15850 [Rubripirellula lacrimiformis]|uniref:GTP-binding protein n=1 Tax=Rubripirellula lacrimiformis TaxID=1930273 RepID=A0A517N7T3_9BACT|nr:DUF4416 family protein [Rubripirellula lacrimiformis]QDT03203.1 hypothetical protein K227x_15850 [Rubripirellula lacrimiformis]
MSSIRLIEPVVRICAVITRHPVAHRWAIEKISAAWGAVQKTSQPVPFIAGGFYDDTMGVGLQKTLIAFGDYQDPGGLADWKIQTNDWESEYAGLGGHDEPRPINLDVGYLSQAKLVLATIKDRDHRIYLRRGIFAEVTLNYVGKNWQHHRWSYPSYRTDEVADFAGRCRTDLRAYLEQTGQIRRVVK